MKLTALCTLLFFTLSPVCSNAAIERSTLKTAFEAGQISITASGTGQCYHDKGLHLKLKNKTGNTLQLKVDPALIFRPLDTSYQDIILPGETIFAIAAHGETDIDLQSFCGKSYARAPGSNVNFNFYRQGDSTMIKVAQFINKYKLYNVTGQSAIWALTNTHNLSGLFDPSNAAISNKLIALMSQLTGWAVPEYYKHYRINTIAGEPALEQRVLKIYSVFEWKLSEPQKLNLGIYNSAGKLIQSVIDNESFIKGGYTLTVTFEAENIATGNYYIRLKAGNSVLKEQMVKLD